MKDRIRNLLINGLQPSEIAGIVGCSPSYISQLVKDPAYAESVQNGKIAAQIERTEDDHIDTRYQNLEHKVISSIEDGLCEASLGEKVRALEILHKRQHDKHVRKNPLPVGTLTINNNVVSLSLPNHAVARIAPAVEMNNSNEIVAIEGRPLAPMSALGVKNLFAQIIEAKQEQQAVLQEI